jgi:hypothetical protein
MTSSYAPLKSPNIFHGDLSPHHQIPPRLDTTPPQPSLTNPKPIPQIPPPSPLRSPIHISIRIQHPKHDPRDPQGPHRARIPQPAHQDIQHGLRRVLEELPVGALLSVEAVRRGGGLHLLRGRVAVRVGDLGSLAEGGHELAVRGREEGDEAQG